MANAWLGKQQKYSGHPDNAAIPTLLSSFIGILVHNIDQ